MKFQDSGNQISVRMQLDRTYIIESDGSKDPDEIARKILQEICQEETLFTITHISYIVSDVE